MKLTGTVRSGMNSFSYWMERLEPYYTAKTGVRLYPGTLNVELEKPFVLPHVPIRLEQEEYGGEVSVNILPCRFCGHPAFILRTDNSAAGLGGHPLTILEIAADIRLRDHFGLKDGDEVVVEID